MQSNKKSKTQKKKSKENEPEEEELNFDNPDFTFVPEGNCQWLQQGPYLVCQSCVLQHSVYIGMNKVYRGLDDEGKPIIEDKEII